jgi:drug/metabolite transporter (DMT)-like permease
MLSLIFLGERVSVFQAIAIITIFAGMFLSTLNINEFRRKTVSIDKGFLFAIIAMVCWGVYFAFIKIPVNKIGWFWPNYFSFLLFPLIFTYMRIKGIKLERPTKNNAFFLIIISTVLVRVAEFSYNFAISKGLVVIVAPIAGANLTLFAILAFLFFKDPISIQQVIGILTTLIGIVTLSFLSI